MGKLQTFAGLGYNILRAKITGKRKPIFLSLFITNRCNLRCKYCFVVDEKVPKDILNAEYTKEEVFAIIDEFKEMGTQMIFLLGGEPMVHKDIKEIVDYIVDKGIYLTICTNGLLIKRKLDEIRRAHVLAVSLDGIGEMNDELRGAGTFKKVVEGIKVAVDAGIPCRIHAVLTRRNLHSIRRLAELSRDLGVVLTVSPPNFLGETDMPELRITNEEYKKFWREYLAMLEEGLPIGNGADAIKKCIEWPKGYHQYIEIGETFDGYKPAFCLNGYNYVALGAEGVMYNCINLGCLNGPNIKEIGIRKAWEKILEWRPNCVSCSSINCIDTSMMLGLRLDTLKSGLRFHAFR